jgi:hypothetical protein
MLTVKPKIEIEIDSKTLLIIPCSAKKLKGGKPITEYKNDFSFYDFWDKDTLELIIKCRKQIKNKHTNCYNESDNEYLPAIQRYVGNVYQPELKKEQPKKTLSYIQKHYGNINQPQIIILSALYGPLHPFELIQNYNLKMGQATSIWKAACEQIISCYVQKNNIDKIVMYTGSGADYFKVMLPTIKSLLAKKLIKSAYQYHVVDGGSSQTPVTHGKLFYADISQTACEKLSRVIELRQGPEFLSTDNNLEFSSEDIESKNIHSNKLKTEIPYSSRSSFLFIINTTLLDEKQTLIDGSSVQCSLNKSGGYDIILTVEIIPKETEVFFTDWVSPDISRFSSRIKAVATSLYQLGMFGIYQVAHKDGLITLKYLDYITIKKQVSLDENTLHSKGLSSFPAIMFRDKTVLTNNVKDAPGVYKWWFPEIIAKRLNIPTDDCTRNSEGKLLLYVGIGKSLRKRFDWHINQKHRSSSIKAGTISTFRHSICSLLSNPLQQEEPINSLIDQLDISFEYSNSKTSALAIEGVLMSQHNLPLNIQGNKHSFRTSLKKQRALCKSRSLKIINDSFDS